MGRSLTTARANGRFLTLVDIRNGAVRMITVPQHADAIITRAFARTVLGAEGAEHARPGAHMADAVWLRREAAREIMRVPDEVVRPK